MTRSNSPTLPVDLSLLPPGTRVGAAVSGGADSVALLRALVGIPGVVVSVAHMHHGIRGAEADEDARFVSRLAEVLGLRPLRRDVDTPALAQGEKRSLEDAARQLRYGWFDELLAAGEVDVIATGHTLDDQAETVLHRLVRGAWTEGLGGVHLVLERPRGRLVRPLLAASRAQVIAYLTALGQSWREDSSNSDPAYTRNRIRHDLLPALAGYNPRITVQLAHLAELARDEEAYWQAELKRLLPSLLLPGRPTRGGGRSSSTLLGERTMAIELLRLRALPPAVQRRVLRAAALGLGAALDYEQTARLLLVSGTHGPKREELAAGLLAERTPRELRLTRAGPTGGSHVESAFDLLIPGTATGFGLTLRAEAAQPVPPARLRAAQAGDRVRLRYSSAPKKVKEVLERMGVPAADRAGWPVVEWQGEIIWMRGAELELSPAAQSIRIHQVEPA